MYGGPGLLTLTAVTIAGNTAGAGGAGIHVIPGYSPTETGSVIANNVSGAGAAYENCSGPALPDGGNNLVYGDSACPGKNSDPKLGPLAANGGATQTLALEAGSAAINLVPSSSCAVTTAGLRDHRAQPATTEPTNRPSRHQCSDRDTNRVAVGNRHRTGHAESHRREGHGRLRHERRLWLEHQHDRPRSGFESRRVLHRPDRPATRHDLPTPRLSRPIRMGQRRAPISPPRQRRPRSRRSRTSHRARRRSPRRRSRAEVVSIKLACAADGPGCTGKLKLSSGVPSRGCKVVGVAARQKPKKAERKTKTETGGTGSYSLSAGEARTFRFPLNRTGKKLLEARKRLPAVASLTGAIKLSRRVTFVYVKPKPKKGK